MGLFKEEILLPEAKIVILDKGEKILAKNIAISSYIRQCKKKAGQYNQGQLY